MTVIKCCLLPHKCECIVLFSLVAVVTLAVYILLTLYFVTPCSIINTERTAVQHCVCVPGIFSISLTSTHHCRCSWLLLHLVTVNGIHTYTCTHKTVVLPGRGISPSQTILLEKHHTHSRQTDIHALFGIRTHNWNNRAASTHVLGGAATGIG